MAGWIMRLVLAIGLLMAAGIANAINIAGWEIDLSLSSLLGTKTDDAIKPQEYARYLNSNSIKLKTVKIPSTYVYIYPTGGYKRKLYNKMQDMEVEAVEKAMGIKFWRIGVDNLGGLALYHQFKQAYTAPRRPIWWSSFRQFPGLSAQGVKKQTLDQFPLFINMNTGRGTTGMTSAEGLADLVLGNKVQKKLMPSLEDSPIQEKRRLKHSIFKMFAYEKVFGKDAIKNRIYMDRDRAYKRHAGQYRGRKLLSKIGLAKPPSPPVYDDDDDDDVTTRTARVREALQVRSKLHSSSRRR